ncbi:Trp biosynthesis-associated membrane protein [Nesterenkonia sp.]|uniref:Trp biosynthesis-associated membrane protein n=1 Tax=Nesterenkonia sp. TaxID=704201 RepID=UPI002637EFAE|nr:Trp biosynthesis-associated membrane protein [Nesterenkonia sp.]
MAELIGRLAYFFQRRNTILVIQAGAILLLGSSLFTWISTGDLSLSGADMAPLVRTLGVVAVIAGVLVSIARRWIRGLLGAVLLGGGVIALIAALLALLNPAAAAAPALSRLGEQAAAYSTGIGLWAALLGSLAVTAGALGVLLFSPGWEDETGESRSSR